MQPLLAGAAMIGAFLAAAKAHGRQVRLERELAGVWKVVFGGENPPAVEAIWRMDRWMFWPVLLVALIAAAAYGLSMLRDQGRVLPLALALPGSFLVAFTAAGMASAMRTLSALRSGAQPAEEWIPRALWGSLGWWGLLAAAVGLLAWALRRA